MPETDVLTPLLVGETNNQQIWMDYIKAHNERNLDKIAKINAKDWIGYTPDGYVVKGTKAHIEALDNWFQSTDPKWEVKWMIANAARNKDGVIEQWLTTGNDYTDVDKNGNHGVTRSRKKFSDAKFYFNFKKLLDKEKDQVSSDDEDPYSFNSTSNSLIGLAIVFIMLGVPLLAVITESPETTKSLPTSINQNGPE